MYLEIIRLDARLRFSVTIAIPPRVDRCRSRLLCRQTTRSGGSGVVRAVQVRFTSLPSWTNTSRSPWIFAWNLYVLYLYKYLYSYKPWILQHQGGRDDSSLVLCLFGTRSSQSQPAQDWLFSGSIHQSLGGGWGKISGCLCKKSRQLLGYEDLTVGSRKPKNQIFSCIDSSIFVDFTDSLTEWLTHTHLTLFRFV